MRDARLTFVDDNEKLMEFLRWLGTTRVVLTVDTETEGLDWWKDKTRLLQVADEEAGWAFPWPMWSGPALSELQTYDGPVVMHNAAFDVTAIEHWGGPKIRWSNLHDTIVMSHLLDPDKPRGLKPACVRHLGGYASTLEHQLKKVMDTNKWTWATIPIHVPAYWGYGCVDAVLTARLYALLAPQVESNYRYVYDLEMATERIAMNMQRKGCRIDIAYCAAKHAELASYVAETKAWARDKWEINIGSNAQVADVLLKDGVQLTERTKTGAWKLDSEVLEVIDHPLAEAALTVRKAAKISSTYFENFLALRDGDLLHPSINTLGARTARMSVPRPALQTNPRGTVVRDAFIPREGHRLLLADSDQIEMRLLAHFCRDPNLIDAILSGDLHTETARRVYRDPTITKKDPRRDTSKNAAFAKVYAAGVEQFARTAGITIPEAVEFLQDYDATFPGVRAFQRAVDRVARERADEDGQTYVLEPSGRRHPCDVKQAYKLINYLIQGTAATTLKEQMVACDMAGLGEYMTLPIHDELMFDVPTELCGDVARTIEQAMTVRDRFVVPITVGVDGPYERWGDKYR